MRRPGVLAWAALVVVYLVWGSTFFAIRIGVRDLPPATLAGARYLLAGLLLYPFAVRSGGAELRAGDRPGPRQWLACAAVGILLLTVGNGGVTIAEQHLESGLAALIAATIPLWMIVYAAAWARRLPGGHDTAGVLVGVLGVALLAGAGGSGHPGSIALSVVAASGWGFGSVLSGHVPLPERTLLGAAIQLLIGGAVLLVVGAARGEWARLDLAAAPLEAYLAFAWLLLPGSILAFSAYAYALARLPVPVVSTYAYVNPVVAVLLGIAFLHESLRPIQAGGAILVVVAVAWGLLRRRDA